MPTYAELAAETWWVAELEPPALAAFNARLRTRYHHSLRPGARATTATYAVGIAPSTGHLTDHCQPVWHGR
jgi:hypothetical protein